LNKSIKALTRSLVSSLRDLAPVIIVVVFFQLAVLQQPLPNLVQLLTGILMVVLGLTFFINGLEMGLFPVGESLAHALARKGSLFWLIVFAFTLGFGTTVDGLNYRGFSDICVKYDIHESTLEKIMAESLEEITATISEYRLARGE